ncbi:MAG: transporter substrate-binding domain-containing protein [Spirochaetes bacterium]|nr:transporter substrate-binding domain-containing protein [Spirochaetota bacterium]MBN2770136.1 transporter substrate-binding domain-containing protein [Spirochaetota bacterium]
MKTSIIRVFLLFIALYSAGIMAQNVDRPLRVGLYNNYPKIYRDKNNEAKGVFPAILKEIADAEGWQIEYRFGTWDECLGMLERGEIDIMPDVAASEQRRKLYDFHQKPVLTSWGCIYTKKKPEINSVPDLQGKTVAVLKGSILTDGEDGIYNLVKRYDVDCNFVEADDYKGVFDLVRSGEADAGVVNRFFGTAFDDEYGLQLNNFIFYPTSLGFAFPKGADYNTVLSVKIDLYLDLWHSNMDSVYYRILTEHNLYPKKKMPLWVGPLIAGLTGLIILFIILALLLRWQVSRKTRLLLQANAKLNEEIDEHHVTMELLEKSRELYRSFAENIPGLVFMYDKDSKGRRQSLIKGNREEEFLGSEVGKRTVDDVNNFFDYVDSEDIKIIEEQSQKAEAGNGILDVEYRVNIDKNKTKWFRSIGRVTPLANGNHRWQGVILDVDDRKKLERQLELHRKYLEELVDSRTQDLQLQTEELEKANRNLKEADKLKSIFLASMSHELRTPLNSIIGFTGILLMGMVGELTDEQRKQLEIIKKSSNHLLALINEILDISKIEANKAELSLEKIEIKDAVQESISLLANRASEKKNKLDYVCEEKFTVYSDRRRISQIVINIAGNAIKFTDKGGVTVAVKKINDKYFELSVLDTGCGVKDEDMQKLFEPFQQIDSSLTKKHEGTGLGLHLSQKIVALLGGSIRVESEYGNGTSFFVKLPIKTEVKIEKSSGD